MSRPLRLAALIAPVLGLAALWGLSDQTYQTGTEWEVPIQGYDPRDYLRGHYVEFSYDWPGLGETRSDPLATLCLEGEPPRLARVVSAPASAQCPHPLRADSTGVYGVSGLMRGRLYVGQGRARQLDEQLQGRDQRGIVTIRQREDGSFTAIAIRFRPLTPAEMIDRDARDAEAQRPFMPPAIMSD
jgi:hypothetical protein